MVSVFISYPRPGTYARGLALGFRCLQGGPGPRALAARPGRLIVGLLGCQLEHLEPWYPMISQ